MTQPHIPNIDIVAARLPEVGLQSPIDPEVVVDEEQLAMEDIVDPQDYIAQLVAKAAVRIAFHTGVFELNFATRAQEHMELNPSLYMGYYMALQPPEKPAVKPAEVVTPSLGVVKQTPRQLNNAELLVRVLARQNAVRNSFVQEKPMPRPFIQVS